MPRSKGHGRSSKAGRHANKKAYQPKDSPTNTPNPLIHTVNQSGDNFAINLNATLDEDVMDETPLDQLKTNTINQIKIP